MFIVTVDHQKLGNPTTVQIMEIINNQLQQHRVMLKQSLEMQKQFHPINILEMTNLM